jgi:hypothetical protein
MASKNPFAALSKRWKKGSSQLDSDFVFLYNPPLDWSRQEIRLLEILPEREGPFVETTLRRVSLKDLPEYTALSYCWDDAQKTTPIVVNGKTIRVTINLEGPR